MYFIVYLYARNPIMILAVCTLSPFYSRTRGQFVTHKYIQYNTNIYTTIHNGENQRNIGALALAWRLGLFWQKGK